FFQAEDGIRDWSVTGVQTCALPIYGVRAPEQLVVLAAAVRRDAAHSLVLHARRRARGGLDDVLAAHRADGHRHGLHHLRGTPARSEERRVGKECRLRWAPYGAKYEV